MQIVTGLFLMFYDLLVQIAAKLRLSSHSVVVNPCFSSFPTNFDTFPSMGIFLNVMCSCAFMTMQQRIDNSVMISFFMGGY